MAKCYVGTYGKYNAGSIDGAWLDLADYQTYGEFVQACKKLHKNEHDPEFMIQDWENLPDGFPCVEWIDESEFNDIKVAMENDEIANAHVRIIDYSDKAFALVGETKAIKDALKEMGGRFNAKLSCGAGWVFPKTRLEMVQKYFTCGGLVERDITKSEKDEALWEEFKQRIIKAEGEKWLDYHLKCTSALMMTECGVILAFTKPHIDVDFCWADEGPAYEEYKSVTANEKSLREYFLEQNLREFDRLIERFKTRKDEYGEPVVPVFYEHNMCSCGLTGYGHELMVKSERYVKEDEDDPRMKDCTHRLTDNDCKKALAILKSERDKFAKRLSTYLKRYGVSKLHTWTYWADR